MSNKIDKRRKRHPKVYSCLLVASMFSYLCVVSTPRLPCVPPFFALVVSIMLPKVIYVCRNPKDVCVSLKHHATNKPMFQYTGDLSDMLTFFAEGR